MTVDTLDTEGYLKSLLEMALSPHLEIQRDGIGSLTDLIRDRYEESYDHENHVMRQSSELDEYVCFIYIHI